MIMKNNDEAEEYFRALIESIPEAELSQMFGKICGKINKKAFVAFHLNCMVFRIGRDHIPELLEKYKGSCLWDPSGKNRPMKDWLMVPSDYQVAWKDLMINSTQYLNS